MKQRDNEALMRAEREREKKVAEEAKERKNESNKRAQDTEKLAQDRSIEGAKLQTVLEMEK